jgi:hypothetical protein
MGQAMRRSSIIFSGAFHMTVLVIAALGLPFLSRHEFIIPPPIIIDYVDISKVTETNKAAPQPAPAKPEEKPAPAAKNTANTAIAPVPKEMPKPEEKKEIKKPAKSAPALDPNAPPDKSKKAKEEEAKPEPSKDFSSVLKNLLDAKTKPTPGQNAPLGAKMTMSEEDALRSQLEKCWNVPFGAKDVENMAVDIFMVINPDRTLREARVVDQTRYNSDNFYRAAADSALRAVRSPLCSPFQLPPDKYDTWNRITVTFNPKDMF